MLQDKKLTYLGRWLSAAQSDRIKKLCMRGVSLTVQPGVFDPDPTITHSSLIVLKNLAPVNGKTVLDVGCGSGVLSIWAAKNGADRVLATDISKAAVDCAVANIEAEKTDVVVRAVEADIVPAGIATKFDVILANLPILTELQRRKDFYNHFLKKIDPCLQEGTVILITHASFADPRPLERSLNRHGFDFEKQSETKMGIEWTLYTACKRGTP